MAALWISPVSASPATDWFDKGNSSYIAGRYDEALAAFNKTIMVRSGDISWCGIQNIKEQQ